MKFSLEVLLIAGLSYLAQLYLPWWSMVLVAGLVGFLFKFENSRTSYAAGFLAIGAFWSILLYLTNTANMGILAPKIASIFQLSPFYLFAITVFIGAFLGGWGALTGTLGRQMFSKKTSISS